MADHVAQLALDDHAAQRFVGQAVLGKIVLVEKVAEGSVADVVQQSGQSQQAFDIAAARGVGADLAEAGVQGRCRPAGQVHHAQHVLKPGVLGRGEDPPGGLKLVDLAEPLQPGVVDDLPLGNLARGQIVVGDEGHVAVQWVETQGFAAEVGHVRQESGVRVRGFGASFRVH